MTFTPKPNLSKRQINMAGRALIGLNPTAPAYEDVLKVVNAWRTCHAYPLNTFKTTLRLKARKYKGAIVAQRLKRLPTIVDKLSRFPEMNLTQMQDIGGVRAVLSSVKEVRKLQAEYKESGRFTHILVKENDYLDSPKSDGYRGVHLVYRYNNTLARNGLAAQYEGLAIELQIRTQLQHTWATAVETVGALKGESFKTGKGGKEWREFFALVSSTFAIAESTSVLPQHLGMTPKQIYKEIKNHVRSLNLLESLTGLTATANFIDGDPSSGYYNIIVLDVSKRQARIFPFAKKDFDKATDMYAVLESTAKPGEDVVLVSAGDLKSLRAAYPNYFLDIREFIEKVKVIIEAAE